MNEKFITLDDKKIILDNYLRVRDTIKAASKEAGRNPIDIRLIVVSKTQSVRAIEPLLELGHLDFGENRIQEAQSKWLDLKTRFPRVKLHLIGPLQTNKVLDAVKISDMIHSLDRYKLALSLVKAMDRSSNSPDCFIQVNTGAELQKSGVSCETADDFIKECRDIHRISVVGLMCLPPKGQDPTPHFVRLKEIADRNSISHLSMGMSSDFVTAIKCGATHIRVGTSIFGMREY